MSTAGRIPVLVVGGFLGSGKTSLLRHLLAGATDTAVIVNEFGAVGLDHQLLRACEEQVELLGGGCACCTRRADLVRALRDLLDAHDRGTARLSRVVIETSGLADPAPIVFTITNDPMLRHHFEVERLVVTVDAVNWSEQLGTHPEARKQVLVADELVITKLDLVEHEEGAGAAVAGAVRALNPAATLRTALHGVLGDAPPQSGQTPSITHAAAETADDLAHTDDVSSLSLEPDGPIDWLGFAVWLSMLLHARGQDVLRVKGLVELEDHTLVSVNGVQHVVHTPEHLDRSTITDPVPGVVFITRGMEIERLRESFDAFQRLARATNRLTAK
ncbi:MAG TPA: GTP-binding protein [Solirubrobacteraceae bacterium]|nr:GTP-binding protein [Solirubrobacteraceae bacterium]